MKITSVKSLVMPEIKVISYQWFKDDRGYFTEPFRLSDIQKHIDIPNVLQSNESVSAPCVVRGLHFQWNPFMGKLVRTISGHMIDMVLDIRKGSPTYGHIIMYDMPAIEDGGEWIWIPPGFAHGNVFLRKTKIEYFCTGEYSQGCESGISPLAPDLNWLLCDDILQNKLLDIRNPIISDKDKNGLSLAAWTADERSNNFTLELCNGNIRFK